MRRLCLCLHTTIPSNSPSANCPSHQLSDRNAHAAASYITIHICYCKRRFRQAIRQAGHKTQASFTGAAVLCINVYRHSKFTCRMVPHVATTLQTRHILKQTLDTTNTAKRGWRFGISCNLTDVQALANQLCLVC